MEKGRIVNAETKGEWRELFEGKLLPTAAGDGGYSFTFFYGCPLNLVPNHTY